MKAVELLWPVGAMLLVALIVMAMEFVDRE
jgi:hypothetical protein